MGYFCLNMFMILKMGYIISEVCTILSGGEKMGEQILSQIEYCREEMVQLSTHMPLSSKEVVEVSKRLDTLLNQYESLRDK